MRSIHYILILSLICQQGGMMCYQSISQFLWKAQVQGELSRLKDEVKEYFVFPINDFAKLRINDKEFLYNKSMYDVIKIHSCDNELHIVAHKDYKEHEIIYKLKNHIKNLVNDFCSNIKSAFEKLGSFVSILIEAAALQKAKIIFIKNQMVFQKYIINNTYIFDPFKPPQI